LHSAAIEHPLVHVISAALLLGAHRKGNRPIGGINVGQKIVID
jgi:hypothetical protein